MSEQQSSARRARLVGIACICVVWALLVLIAVLGPAIAPYDPTHTGAAAQFEAPSSAHPLGADELGRDIWSRFLWGGQATLGGALLALVVASVLGGVISLAALLDYRRVDQAVGHALDVLLAFPGLLVALIAVTLLGKGPVQVAAAVGISLAPTFARLIRGSIRGVSHQPFIGATYALGANRWWVARRHILRNVLPQVLAVAAVVLAWALLDSAALEFLGLAGPPEAPTWGGMIGAGRAYLREARWEVLAPGLALAISVLGLMLLGNLRRLLNRSED